MKGFFHILSLVCLLGLMACGQLMFGRSYLSEMEQDDSRFFEPGNDFPVVSGDSGRSWISENERRARTPASESDLENDRNRSALQEELSSLEALQSESAYHFYDNHKHKLTTISERIYFLKLPHFERRDYLQSRGMLDQERQYESVTDKMFRLRQSEIILGMNKDDVLNSWGKPARVEIAGNPRNENERWLYTVNGATKYIYFESGRVGGWE